MPNKSATAIKDRRGTAALIAGAYMLAKAYINAKHLIRRAITVVVIWNVRIPRYNGNTYQLRSDLRLSLDISQNIPSALIL